MRTFQLGVRTSDGSSGAAACEIIAGANKGFFLVGAMNVSMAAATASTYGLGRPAAKGITPTSPVKLAANDGAIDSDTTVAVAWATGPTVPAKFFHRATFPATIGQQRDWILPDQGIWVKAGSSVVLWNLAANGVVDFTITIKE